MSLTLRAVGARLLALSTLFACCLAARCFAGDVVLLLDDQPRAPLGVESDELAELAGQIVAGVSMPENPVSLTILLASQDGIIDRAGQPASLERFDALWIAQNDKITRESPLFSPACVEAVTAFYHRADARGILLTGGACALVDELGYRDAFEFAPLTFGEDRAQTGVVPLNPHAPLYANLSPDLQGVIWTTNASFPAFERMVCRSDSLYKLGESSSPTMTNPILGAVDDNNALRLIVFAHRISPLFDAAPQSYRANFTQLLANMTQALGR